MLRIMRSEKFFLFSFAENPGLQSGDEGERRTAAKPDQRLLVEGRSRVWLRSNEPPGNSSKKPRHLWLRGSFLGMLAVGVLMSPVIEAQDQAAPAPPSAGVTSEHDLRNAFVKVADIAGPAVVSISSERVQRIPGGRRRVYIGPGGSPFGNDDFFDQFFKDFFGNVPEREFKQQGLGSGVIIDKDGYILTNEHVISGAEKITVTLSDGRSFQAALKGTDPRSDLAVIKIDAKDLPFAQLGDSDLVQTGEWAVAIGNPFGFAVNNPNPTVTVSVISALHRQLPGMMTGQGIERTYLDLIQTDAAINPGNSGGPLCDLDGKVIGINVAIVSTTGGYQGIGFAIPSNLASSVVGDLIKGKRIVYGWFGVSVQEVTEGLAKAFGLPAKTGALVATVVKDSPAQKAGIKEGDVITKISGVMITSVRDVLRNVGSRKPGERVEVAFIRDKKETTVQVTVGERPTTVAPEEKAQAKSETAQDVIWRGVSVIDITPEIAKRYTIEDTAGALISNVEPGSAASEGGLTAGDIIREINKISVKGKADFNKIAAKVAGDALVRTDKGYFIVKEPEKQ